MARIEVDGLQLNVEQHGSGPAVVLLHGFTGSATTWNSLTDLLSPEFEVIAIDIVGHGESDAPVEVDRYRMDRCTEDLVTLLAKLGHEHATWLGYSMGARTALQLAVLHPDAVDALVLEGVTAGLPDAGERTTRIESDEALADRIRDQGLGAFVDFWQSIGLWDTQMGMPAVRLAALREQRMRSDPVGLANSLRGMGAGAQEPVIDRLGEVRAPVLLIAGSLDQKFTDIAQELLDVLPRGKFAAIEGVGHAAHFEDAAAFNDSVLAYLRAIHSGEISDG
jgi:2-succinyl-6-hydroxy-2,4-cyclohexadiene-1-carboxylate synthase